VFYADWTWKGAFKWDYNQAPKGTDTTFSGLLDYIYSSLSFNLNGDSKDIYQPVDYVTVDYNGYGYDESGGVLKIVTLDARNKPINTTKETLTSSRVAMASGKKIDDESVLAELLYPTKNKKYPDYWRDAIIAKALDSSVSRKSGNDQYWQNNYGKIYDFYVNLKKAMPLMMAYRWHSQILSNLTDSKGRLVTDYEDEENTLAMKVLPIMDFEGSNVIFSNSFKNGQFQAGKQFQFTHCIVDLNPTASSDDITGKFPMKFASNISVNQNEYKTSKMVLSRVDAISGDKFVEFSMGSHASDYD